MVRFHTKLLFFLPLVSFARGQDEDFKCGLLDPLPAAMDIGDKSFDTLNPEDSCGLHRKSRFLAPEDIYWHVYAIDDNETPRISSLPENLVIRQTRGQ